MTNWVDDATWAQLDPAAGRLDRRGRVLGGVVTVLLVVAFTAAIGAGHSGLISPHLSGAYTELTVDPGTRRFTETVQLTTTGTFDERLIGVQSAMPGIAVTVIGSLPRQITRHGGTPLRLQVQITDCTAARTGNAIALTLRVQRFWGALSRTIIENPQSDLPENPIDTACR